MWINLLLKAGDTFVALCRENDFIQSFEKVVKVLPRGTPEIQLHVAKTISTATNRFPALKEFGGLFRLVQEKLRFPQVCLDHIPSLGNSTSMTLQLLGPDLRR